MSYYLRTLERGMVSDISGHGFLLWEVGKIMKPYQGARYRGIRGMLNGRGDPNSLYWEDSHKKWVVFSSEDEAVSLQGGWYEVESAKVEYIGDVSGALGFLAEREGLSLREWVCKDPAWALQYGTYVDRGGRDDTREAVCKTLDPRLAYRYALEVEREGHNETRKVACTDPFWAYRYAYDVDRCRRDDTREAACQDPEYAYNYAKKVDEGARYDTREAASKDPEYAALYAKDVDGVSP